MQELVKNANELISNTKFKKCQKIFYLSKEEMNSIQKRIDILCLVEEFKEKMEKICIPN